MQNCVYLWYTLAAAFALGNCRAEDSLKAVFDLELDPFELRSVYHDGSYSTSVAFLEERLAFWRNVSTTEEMQDTDHIKTWISAGGVVPWKDASSSPPPKPAVRPEVAALPGAPNLVFIMIDDVGWNDPGYEGSSWLNFATPNMDHLVSNGIRLSNHYTGWICGPTRAAFMTGRHPYRLGYSRMPEADANLPLQETTLAQELQLVGYRTAVVGKWHLGMQSWAYTPTFRGFDRFYGYLGGSIGYYSKLTAGGLLDLTDQESLVTNETEVSPSVHLSLLLQEKVEDVIAVHAATHTPNGTPLFLYYAPQNGEGHLT